MKRLSPSDPSRQIVQTSHGFAVGELIYHTGSAYDEALASHDIIGIVASVQDANTFTILTEGYVSGLSGLTAGTVYYASESTPGAITATEPTTEGNDATPMLVADSTTSGYFKPPINIISSLGFEVEDLQPFDPSQKRWRAALGARKESNVDVVVVGDSLAELGDGGIAYRFIEHFARQTAADLGMGYGIYYPAVAGDVITTQTGDPWTLSGGAAGYDFTTYWGLGSRSWVGTANGNQATLNFTGDRVILLYTQYVAGSTAAEVVLDGAIVATLDMSDAVTTNGLQWDSGALTYGAHTLIVRYPSGTANGALFVEGAMVEYGPRPCFRVWDSSQSGYSAASYAGQATNNSFYTSLPNIDPALVIFCLGANDAVLGQTPAQVITNLNTLVTRIQGVIDPDASFAILVEWEPGTESAGFYDAFAESQRITAHSSSWQVIDLNAAAGRLQTDTYGITTDLVHASKKGHRLIADLMSRTVFGDVKGTLDVITSTSGKTIIGDSAYDFVNRRLGVGTRSPAYKTDIRTPGVIASQLHLSSLDADSGAYMTTISADSFFLQGGAALNSSAQWVAKGTSAHIMGGIAGVYNFYVNTSLTPGNTFTPGEVFRLVNASGSLSNAIPNALANASTNYIAMGTVGLAAPAFTTRSNGSRMVFYPAVAGASADYALGIESGFLWSGVATVNASLGWKWYGGTTEVARLLSTGFFGIGVTPTAVLHLKAGTATANTAPIKLTSGTNLTTPEAGAIEFDGTHFYGTIGSTRIALDNAVTGQVYLSASGMWPRTTGGSSANTKVESTTNLENLYFLDFDPTTDEFAQCSIAMPLDWNGGTVTATFYWTANSTSTNSVVWTAAGRSFNDAETLDQAFGTAQSVTDANGATANQLRISSATSAITLAGTPAAGELVVFQVSRDADNGSDTLVADARLIGVMINYTKVQ